MFGSNKICIFPLFSLKICHVSTNIIKYSYEYFHFFRTDLQLNTNHLYHSMCSMWNGNHDKKNQSSE